MITIDIENNRKDLKKSFDEIDYKLKNLQSEINTGTRDNTLSERAPLEKRNQTNFAESQNFGYATREQKSREYPNPFDSSNGNYNYQTNSKG